MRNCWTILLGIVVFFCVAQKATAALESMFFSDGSILTRLDRRGMVDMMDMIKTQSSLSPEGFSQIEMMKSSNQGPIIGGIIGAVLAIIAVIVGVILLGHDDTTVATGSFIVGGVLLILSILFFIWYFRNRKKIAKCIRVIRDNPDFITRSNIYVFVKAASAFGMPPSRVHYTSEGVKFDPPPEHPDPLVNRVILLERPYEENFEGPRPLMLTDLDASKSEQQEAFKSRIEDIIATLAELGIRETKRGTYVKDVNKFKFKEAQVFTDISEHPERHHEFDHKRPEKRKGKGKKGKGKGKGKGKDALTSPLL